MTRRFSNVIGFDDAPFSKQTRGNTLIVGAIFSGQRLVGVLSGHVRRDGANATSVISRLISESCFADQIQVVMLQGIAMAGFNVIDLQELYRQSGVPVLVVARRQPDLERIRHALISRVRGGKRKWKLIERAGPMEPLAGVFVQRAGLSLKEAEDIIRRFAVNGNIPEPIRVAHLIAGGIVRGESRGRA